MEADPKCHLLVTDVQAAVASSLQPPAPMALSMLSDFYYVEYSRFIKNNTMDYIFVSEYTCKSEQITCSSFHTYIKIIAIYTMQIY